MRRAAKRDASEKPIVDALRKTGWSVEFLSLPDGPDLAIGKNGWTGFAECKTGKGKLRPGQERWHREWKGAPVLILRSVDDVGLLNAGLRQPRSGEALSDD